MTVAIMQPYLFPYLGYWQMLKAVDKFVLFNDVNFIKRGWINRNNILLGEQPYLFTLPLAAASQNKLICEMEVADNDKEKNKILKTITQCYAKAPYFNKFYSKVESIIQYPERNLSKFLLHHFTIMAGYLGISTKILLSSDFENTSSLVGQKRIIDICKCLGAKKYINAIGGQSLYHSECFAEENIELKFIKMHTVSYKQYGKIFVPGLSIIDILMFNDIEEVHVLLNAYELI